MYLLHQEPYVVKHHHLLGIIPEQVNILKQRCPSLDIQLRIVPWSLEEARKIVTSSNPMTVLNKKENTTTNDRHIIFGAWNYHHLDEHDRFIAYPLVHSPGVAVLVHRDSLALGYKLWKAMGDSMLFLYNGFLFATLVGITIWLLERNKNPMFTNSLGSGIMNGIWFGVVTMTSVGYGDISPKTMAGKILCIVFMLGSSLHLAALTSLYTERVGTDTINLKDAKISVMNGSRSMNVARQMKKFHSDENIIKTSSFHDAMEKVSDKSVEASLIDYNIASWCQEDVLTNNLRFTIFLQKQFDLYIYIHKGDNHNNDHDVIPAHVTELAECLEKYEKEREYVSDAYIRDVNFVTVDNMDISYAMKRIGITPIATLLTAIVLMALLLYRLINATRKNTVETANIVESDILGKRAPSLEMLQMRLDEKLQNIRKEVTEEYKELIEHWSNNNLSVGGEYSSPMHHKPP